MAGMPWFHLRAFFAAYSCAGCSAWAGEWIYARLVHHLHEFVCCAFVDCGVDLFSAGPAVSDARMDVCDSAGAVRHWQRARVLSGGSVSNAVCDGRGGWRALVGFAEARMAIRGGGNFLCRGGGVGMV